MRRIAFFTAIVALLLAVLLWISHRDGASEHAVAPAVVDRTDAKIDISANVPTPETPIDRRSVQAPIEPTPASTAVAARGTIIVLDASGQEHARESGVLTLRVPGTPGKPVESMDLPVSNGMWDPQATPAVDCYIAHIVLGSREAILEGDHPAMLIAKQPATLRARWLTSTILHVVDARSRAELDQLRLMSMDQMWSLYVVIPTESSNATLFGKDMTSPIEVDPKSPQLHGEEPVMFAYRYGYAWSSMPIDLTGGGDQVLKLSPGADLKIKLTGGIPSASIFIRLWKQEASGPTQIVERALSDVRRPNSEILLTGLAEGNYEAHLERGAADKSQVIANAAVAIVAGSDASVDLAVPAAPADEFAQVVVVVRLDPTWDLKEFIVDVHDLDRPREMPKFVRNRDMQEREPHVFASKPIRLRVARQQLYLDDAQFGIECEVTSASPQEVTLDVPACGKVVVIVKDAVTGALVEKPVVCYQYLGNKTSSGNGMTGIAPSGPGRVEVRSPLGKIRLFVHGEAGAPYLTESPELDVVAGDQEIAVALKRARTITIVFHEGERPVDCGMAVMNLKLFDARGPVTAQGTSFGSGKLTCLVKDAENYTLSLPPVAGYMPIPDMQVDLTSQDLADLVIQLVRQQ